MSRDSQRYRKTYSYHRVQPRTELLEVIVDESLDWKRSVRTASTSNHDLAGTIPLTVDGISLVDEDRILLKDQADPTQNGIYYYEVEGSSYNLTRASDASQGTLSCGAATYIEEGSTNGGKVYIMSTTGDISVDSTSLTWTELSGGGGGGIGGSGTSGYVAKFTGGSTIGNSSIRDDGTNVGIGTATFTSRLFVSGSSTASSPTLTVKEGQPTSFGTPILEVQNSLGTSLLYVTGNLGTVGGRIGIGTNIPDAKLHVSSSYGGASHGISIGQPNFLGFASNTYTSRQHTFYGGDGTSKRLLIDDNGNVILGGELPGITTNTTRLLVTGSSTSTNGTLVVKAGVPSPTGPLLDIQDYAGNSIVFVSGSGLSGSLTKLTDGTSYLRAGTNVTITTGSNGSVTIAASSGPQYWTEGSVNFIYTTGSIGIGGTEAIIEKNGNDMKFYDTVNPGGYTLTQLATGGGSSPAYWFSTTNAATYTTGSVAIRGGLVSVDDASDIGSNVFFFVSGSVTGSGTNDKKAVFGGDVVMSGTLQVAGDVVEITGSLTVTNGISGSLTKLSDGTSYLIAGSGINISSASNGPVTISATGGSGPTGSGTDGYLAQWSGGTTVLGDSFIQNYDSDTGRYYKNEHRFYDSLKSTPYVYVTSNATNEGAIGLNQDPTIQAPGVRLYVANLGGLGTNVTEEMIRVRNHSGDPGSGTSQTFIAGNFSDPTFRISHAWPSVTSGHYAFFGIAQPSSGLTSTIVERFRMYSSGSVEVSGSFQARLDPEIINKPVVSVQKSDGSEVMWISSSAGSHPVGTDVFMWVSGSRTNNNTGADKVVFGGDVRVSGSLSVGTGSVLITSNDVQFGGSDVRIQRTSSGFSIFTNSSEAVRVGSTGVVGIGTSGTISARLFVSGTTSHSNGVILVRGGNSTDPLVVHRSSANSVVAVFDATGSLGIGTSAPGEKIHITNGNLKFENTYGIDFSSTSNTSATGATTTSEVLTDYEEGTWTPIFAEDYSPGGAEGTMSISSVGSYVKIGRQVTATCRAIQASPGTPAATGQFIIKGLPYPCGSTFGGAAIGYYSGLKGNIYSLYGEMQSGYDHVKMYAVIASGGSVTAIDYDTYCNKSGDININMTVTYQV